MCQDYSLEPSIRTARYYELSKSADQQQHLESKVTYCLEREGLHGRQIDTMMVATCLVLVLVRQSVLRVHLAWT